MSVQAEASEQTAKAVAAALLPLPVESDALFAVTDQLGERILVLAGETDIAAAESGSARAVWSWSPPPEVLAGRSSAWGRPSDVRLCRDAEGEPWMLVTDSYGLVFAVDCDGRTRWWVDLGRYANPHAAQLLPDGRIAVAASTGGWVRIYRALGADGPGCVEMPVAEAHGLVWDSARSCLWVLGLDRLLAVSAHRSRSLRGARELRTTFSVTLPTSGGHDLQPVRNDPDRLWVTTSRAVYQFSKSERAWLSDYDNAAVIDTANVKSIGNTSEPGTVLRAIPEPGLEPEWLTGRVEFVGRSVRSTAVPGHIYKARPWLIENS